MKMGENRIYAAIDLKSFYASVECVSLGLDPLKTNLVVADNSRTDKTICLAVSPGLKSFGVPGRPRLFQVISKVKEINEQRFQKNGFHPSLGASLSEKAGKPDKPEKKDGVKEKHTDRAEFSSLLGKEPEVQSPAEKMQIGAASEK